ncbi:hypothetical protein RchiOBHm_Chr7g0218221 [Rosa chinensis]|uniref:Uncharacterized protein n=1 Tax=Rosa chinensis TaxID=74649 RepID=A0A2P6PC75_ROSCH|nr:hypothetical protein RchiOBHm_Chr7g0218221 [Rosa chinensis]
MLDPPSSSLSSIVLCTCMLVIYTCINVLMYVCTVIIQKHDIVKVIIGVDGNTIDSLLYVDVLMKRRQIVGLGSHSHIEFWCLMVFR